MSIISENKINKYRHESVGWVIMKDKSDEQAQRTSLGCCKSFWIKTINKNNAAYCLHFMSKNNVKETKQNLLI